MRQDIPEVKILKALGDETRLRILLTLRSQELCVCQVVELLSLAPSTVSKHLQILKDARLVDSQKRGRWVYYRLTIDDVEGFPINALRAILQAAGNSDQAGSDTQQLTEILKLDPEVLCGRQRA